MKIVFSDFDGTLTFQGELSPIFFDVLNLIKQHDSELIIVSGRSLSWGHFLLTHFPLRYVVMEGGGVVLQKNAQGLIQETCLAKEEDLVALQKAQKEISELVGASCFAADSYGRKTDRAIEFSKLEKTDQKKIINYLDLNHLSYSRSNVHLNIWKGELSKANGVEFLLNNFLSHIDKDDCIYYGDAPNDQSMFAFLNNSVGVSNILPFLDEIETPPKVVLEGKENIGVLGVLAHLKDIFDKSSDF